MFNHSSAITLAVLNLVGVSLQTYLAPFTLAILALLAINGLGNRFRIEELVKTISNCGHFFHGRISTQLQG